MLPIDGLHAEFMMWSFHLYRFYFLLSKSAFEEAKMVFSLFLFPMRTVEPTEFAAAQEAFSTVLARSTVAGAARSVDASSLTLLTADGQSAMIARILTEIRSHDALSFDRLGYDIFAAPAVGPHRLRDICSEWLRNRISKGHLSSLLSDLDSDPYRFQSPTGRADMAKTAASALSSQGFELCSSSLFPWDIAQVAFYPGRNDLLLILSQETDSLFWMDSRNMEVFPWDVVLPSRPLRFGLSPGGSLLWVVCADRGLSSAALVVAFQLAYPDTAAAAAASGGNNGSASNGSGKAARFSMLADAPTIAMLGTVELALPFSATALEDILFSPVLSSRFANSAVLSFTSGLVVVDASSSSASSSSATSPTATTAASVDSVGSLLSSPPSCVVLAHAQYPLSAMDPADAFPRYRRRLLHYDYADELGQWIFLLLGGTQPAQVHFCELTVSRRSLEFAPLKVALPTGVEGIVAHGRAVDADHLAFLCQHCGSVSSDGSINVPGRIFVVIVAVAAAGADLAPVVWYELPPEVFSIGSSSAGIIGSSSPWAGPVYYSVGQGPETSEQFAGSVALRSLLMLIGSHELTVLDSRLKMVCSLRYPPSLERGGAVGGDSSSSSSAAQAVREDCVAISQSGRFVAVAGFDRTMHTYELVRSRPMPVVVGSSTAVRRSSMEIDT